MILKGQEFVFYLTDVYLSASAYMYIPSTCGLI